MHHWTSYTQSEPLSLAPGSWSILGVDLDDFISGPRELLLKFVDENYPLPDKPESLSGDDGVKELQRKRHSATPGVSIRGRVRKDAKLQDESDVDSDLESETDTDPDCVESDDEFQICEICSSETERKKLLQCSCCKQLMHPACLVPPVVGAVPADWSCHSCKEKTEEYLQNRRVYLAQLLEWYEKAVDRKSQILDAVHSLDLPNNPLDDIIDQKPIVPADLYKAVRDSQLVGMSGYTKELQMSNFYQYLGSKVQIFRQE